MLLVKLPIQLLSLSDLILAGLVVVAPLRGAEETPIVAVALALEYKADVRFFLVQPTAAA